MAASGATRGGRQTDLLKDFGLSRNPFVDRTAEKTELDDVSLYVHSDLQGFRPSETTYIFFGKRGSGKTTIRMQMQRAYQEHNDAARACGRTRGHFMVDLARPGHLTACLRAFQERVAAGDDNWDAAFAEHWHTDDMVDCILSYAATHLVDEVTDVHSVEGADMLERIRADPRASKQFLLLAHLYAKTDATSLDFLRWKLAPPRYSSLQLGTGVAVGAALAGGASLASRDPEVARLLNAPLDAVREEVGASAPFLAEHPRLSLALAGGAGLAGAYAYRRWRRTQGLDRASALTAQVRVVKQQPPEKVASLLSCLFSSHDSAETIRQLCVGVSAHQKLDLLAGLVRLLGFESVAVFGDCFDEVVLLDPVQYPGALKVFAREVCKNDLLNFGRLHFFFPDSRLALDLSTDRTLKEARFDRHFVRDLQWSRHQLEELAERRFMAAQMQAAQRAAAAARAGSPRAGARPGSLAASPAGAANGAGGQGEEGQLYSFAELFRAVRVEDFSSYISKLSTPRELMLFMTELLSRIEAHPDTQLSAQDLEIAVCKALEQAV